MSLNCEECKSSLYPENPTLPSYDRRQHLYRKPLCYGCGNYELVIEQQIKPIPKSQPRYDSLLGELRKLERDLNAHIDLSKKLAKKRGKY